jgi:hypothetical protein
MPECRLQDRLLRATGTGEGSVTFTRCEGGDRGQRARGVLDVTNPHDIPERFNLRRTARTFPVTSPGAKRSRSAWPSTNTGLDRRTGGRRTSYRCLIFLIDPRGDNLQGVVR